jgi:hypothetical protein
MDAPESRSKALNEHMSSVLPQEQTSLLRAPRGHAATPPSSEMNSRRFTARTSRASDRKDSTP